jgi:predicted GTPase
MNIHDWEKDFDLANPNPSDNSDFDEDNGIDYEKVTTSKIVQDQPGVTSENLMKKRPIMVSIIGRPNMGKSTLVNALIE